MPHLASAARPDAPACTPPGDRDVWALTCGATVLGAAQGTRFSVWAPRCRSCAVRLVDAAGGTRSEHALVADAGGVYDAVVPGVEAGADYYFVLDGEHARPDPVSRWQPHGVHGPSRVVDPGAFAWTDHAWRAPAVADFVIYELHVGTFSAEGTFAGVIPHLSDLRELGVTAIEIMPVAQFPGDRNWGYDGVHLYAPHDGYGGPAGLRQLVDAAHRVGLAVVLDVVYNHLGPEGNYLDAFGPYFTECYRTPWGRAMNYDGPDSGEVRRFVVDNARYWITEFHIDALRLDAVHAIFDHGATHVLAALTTAVRTCADALGRRAVLIAESDRNDPAVVRDTAAHGLGFDAQWADDFHHAVHAVLTGERRGYYEDFGDVAQVAEALRSPFVYAGRYSAHRRRCHGAPAAGIARDHFVVCLQNHDQVGNRAGGERLSVLVPAEQQRLAAALLLLSPYVPLLFMGEEYGETNPFQYFVSHGDPALVEAVRAGRRAEFAAFGWADRVPDPFAVTTFETSKLDRSKQHHPEHASLRALYRDLLRVRRSEPALRPGDAEVRVAAPGDGRCIALHLVPWTGAARPLVAVFNLSEESRRAPLPHTDRWSRVLATTAAAAPGASATVAPWSAVLYAADPSE